MTTSASLKIDAISWWRHTGGTLLVPVLLIAIPAMLCAIFIAQMALGGD